MIAALALVLQVSPIWMSSAGGDGRVPAPWRVTKVGGSRPTSYRIASVAGRDAIEARVESSMALLARPITVDLARTPILCWRWFVDGVVKKGNIRTKAGNDFAARIYVGFDMPDSAIDGMSKMKLRIARSMYGAYVPDAALTYVWDNRTPVGTAMRSPYTSRQELIVAQSGDSRAGQWTTERFDVSNDFARAFSGKPGKAVQLAVAADGDNTKSSGRAAFTDIHFVARNQQCHV